MSVVKAIGLHVKNATGMEQNEQSVLLARVKGRLWLLRLSRKDRCFKFIPT